MNGGFDAPAMSSPAELPVLFQQAALLVRPVFSITSAPRAAVVLVEIDTLRRLDS